jgi:hypothetical protein
MTSPEPSDSTYHSTEWPVTHSTAIPHSGTDTVFMECHQPGCQYRISLRLRCGDSLPPYVQERWHKRMASHVRRKHMRPLA